MEIVFQREREILLVYYLKPKRAKLNCLFHVKGFKQTNARGSRGGSGCSKCLKAIHSPSESYSPSVNVSKESVSQLFVTDDSSVRTFTWSKSSALSNSGTSNESP